MSENLCKKKTEESHSRFERKRNEGGEIDYCIARDFELFIRSKRPGLA